MKYYLGELKMSDSNQPINNYHNQNRIQQILLPGGHHWSGRVQRGTLLQFKALGRDANVSMYCVNAEEKLEHFNMPDSLKAQHTAYLTTGHVLYSDLGRVMASIVFDEHGWNDVLCGPSRPEQIIANFGQKTFEQARNDMYQNGIDSLLIEMSKFNLSAKDLSATVNLFSKVTPDDEGNLTYQATDNQNQIIEMRFEMNCLVFLSAAPHGLDKSSNYQPADIELNFYKAFLLNDKDICRDSCEQNIRGFANTTTYYAI